jgi:hypothetical protein
MEWWSRDSPVRTETKLRMEDRGSIPGGGNGGILPLRNRVQTDSGAHPASYPMGNGGSYLGGKATGEWSWSRMST